MLPTDLAPTIRVHGKDVADPFGRAYASRLDGPLLKPTMEIAVRASENAEDRTALIFSCCFAAVDRAEKNRGEERGLLLRAWVRHAREGGLPQRAGRVYHGEGVRVRVGVTERVSVRVSAVNEDLLAAPMACQAMPCHAILCHAMPCHGCRPAPGKPCHAILCHAMPCHAMSM